MFELSFNQERGICFREIKVRLNIYPGLQRRAPMFLPGRQELPVREELHRAASEQGGCERQPGDSAGASEPRGGIAGPLPTPSHQQASVCQPSTQEAALLGVLCLLQFGNFLPLEKPSCWLCLAAVHTPRSDRDSDARRGQVACLE